MEAEARELREDGALAVRWAHSSAHHSERLVELFGPEARDGITLLERQVVELEAKLARVRASNTHTGLRAALQKQAARADALEAENQRLRGFLTEIKDGTEVARGDGTSEWSPLDEWDAHRIAN